LNHYSDNFKTAAQEKFFRRSCFFVLLFPFPHILSEGKKIAPHFPISKRGNAMKRKTGKHLLLLLFLLPLLILLQNFIQQRSQASLLKPDTCFTESFREQALSSVPYFSIVSDRNGKIFQVFPDSQITASQVIIGFWFEAQICFPVPGKIFGEKFSIQHSCCKKIGKFSI